MPINQTMKVQKIGSKTACFSVGTANTKNPDKVLKKLSLAKTTPNSHYSLFNAEFVVSPKHVWHAVNAGLSAFETDSMILKDLALEIVVRLSGQRQVKMALDLFALDNAKTVGVVVIADSKKELEQKFREIKTEFEFKELNEKTFFEQNWKKNSGKIKKAFGISEKEISAFEQWPKQKAVEALIIERIALLGLE